MKFDLPRKRNPRIEMLPLIDIVFLLLVVFIYSMLSMSVHHGMPVRLPESASAAPEKEAVLSVTVTSPAEIFVNHERTDMDELAAVLETKSAAAEGHGILIFADKSLPYQVLFSVLDRVKRAGYTRISLQAELDQQGKE